MLFETNNVGGKLSNEFWLWGNSNCGGGGDKNKKKEYVQLHLNSDYKLNGVWNTKLIYIAVFFYYISMIRYLVLVGGIIFYAFAVTNLLKEIRTLSLI